MKNIIVYKLIYNLHRDYDVVLAEFGKMPLPSIGDIVNIDGNPYIVYKVGHALSQESSIMHTYVKVFKAGDFDVHIGDKK